MTANKQTTVLKTATTSSVLSGMMLGVISTAMLLSYLWQQGGFNTLADILVLAAAGWTASKALGFAKSLIAAR